MFNLAFILNKTLHENDNSGKGDLFSFPPFFSLVNLSQKVFAQSNPDCSDEQPYLIKTIYTGIQSEEKKRAMGFYTLSSKASADQRVLVVLFNGY